MLSGKVRRDAILIEQSFPLARALLGLGLSIIRFSLLSHSTTIPQQAKLIEQKLYDGGMVQWMENPDNHENAVDPRGGLITASNQQANCGLSAGDEPAFKCKYIPRWLPLHSS